MRQMQTIVIAALMLVLFITCGAQTVFGKPMPPRFFHYTYEFIPALQPGPVTLRLTLYDTTGCTDITAEFFQDDNMGYSGPKTFEVTKTAQEPSVTIDLPVVLPQDDTCGFWMKFESSCRTPQWAGRFWVTGPDSVEEWTHDVRVYAVNTRVKELIPDSSALKAFQDYGERMMNRPGEAVWPSENGRQLTPEEAAKRAQERFRAAQKAHYDSLRAVGDSGWVQLEDGTKKKVDRNEHRREVEMQKLRELEKVPLEGNRVQSVMIDGEQWNRSPGDTFFHKAEAHTMEEWKEISKHRADSVRQWADTAIHDLVLYLEDPEQLERASRVVDSLIPLERENYYRTIVRGDKLLELRKLRVLWDFYPSYPTPPPKGRGEIDFGQPAVRGELRESDTSLKLVNASADDPFFYGFESNEPLSFAQAWEATDGNWLSGIDTWGRDYVESYNGSYSAWCADDGDAYPTYDYDMDALMWLRTPVDLTEFEWCSLSFQMWYQTEPLFDYLTCYISIDGGNLYVQQLSNRSGESGGWEWFDYQIPDGSPGVSFYFEFVSDGLGALRQGAYIDEVQVSGSAIEYPNITYYRPPFWDDPLIVTNNPSTGSNNGEPIHSDQPAYINWGIRNNGEAHLDYTWTAISVDGSIIDQYWEYDLYPGETDDSYKNIEYSFSAGYQCARFVLRDAARGLLREFAQ